MAYVLLKPRRIYHKSRRRPDGWAHRREAEFTKENSDCVIPSVARDLGEVVARRSILAPPFTQVPRYARDDRRQLPAGAVACLPVLVEVGQEAGQIVRVFFFDGEDLLEHPPGGDV